MVSYFFKELGNRAKILENIVSEETIERSDPVVL